MRTLLNKETKIVDNINCTNNNTQQGSVSISYYTKMCIVTVNNSIEDKDNPFKEDIFNGDYTLNFLYEKEEGGKYVYTYLMNPTAKLIEHMQSSMINLSKEIDKLVK